LLLSFRFFSLSTRALVKRTEIFDEQLFSNSRIDVRNIITNGRAICVANRTVADPCVPAVNVQLLDNNVPAMARPKVCVVFWNDQVSTEVKQNIVPYLSKLSATTYYDGLSEYGMQTKPILHSACGNGVTLNPSITDSDYCDDEHGQQFRCVSEVSFQNELVRNIAHQRLPLPDSNTLYTVFFPSSVRSHLGDCEAACGVHGYSATSFGPLIYAVLPDLISSSHCQQGCMQFVDAPLDGAKVVLTHEICEIISDPQPTQTTVTWYDQNWGEICDMCIYPGTIGDVYPVSHWWSQVKNKCVTTTSHQNIRNCPTDLPVNCGNGNCCPSGKLCSPANTCVAPSKRSMED